MSGGSPSKGLLREKHVWLCAQHPHPMDIPITQAQMCTPPIPGPPTAEQGPHTHTHTYGGSNGYRMEQGRILPLELSHKGFNHPPNFQL